MSFWLPRFGWLDLSPEEALDFGLEQAGRVTWQLLSFEWLGFGFSISARVKPA